MNAGTADAATQAAGRGQTPAGASAGSPRGLSVEGLRKRFGSVRALQGVTLHAQSGHVHALLGENGAGKSTLIKILSGVTRADEGSVRLDGELLTLGRPAASTAAGVRTAFQELSTIPELTVAENLLFGREPSIGGRVLRRRLNARAAALLAGLGLERIDPTAQVSTLALGDRQLLEVAKALREAPRLLVLDEATSALSSEDSGWVLEQARLAAQRGAVVLLITHRLAEVRAAADRITVLRSGRAVLEGSTSDYDDEQLITAMLGRRMERLYPPLEPASGGSALSVRGLRVGARVGPLDLDVAEGEILGIGGLQGQGQRELLMALAGATAWASGSATLRERPYRPRSPQDALAGHVALVPEDRQREGLLLTHTVRANVTLGALGRIVRHGLIDARRESATARAGAQRVGVAIDRLGTLAGTLSGGNQQKVVLAKALVGEPSVLLLYDCTRGVDVGTKAEIFALMSQLAAAGTTILFYSSDLSELVHMCHRVAVMVEGQVRGVLSRGQLSEGAILRVAVGTHHSTDGAVGADRAADLAQHGAARLQARGDDDGGRAA